MSKLFCVSPGLRVLERQMQQPPGYRPRGYGICVMDVDWRSRGNYSEIVDCVISRMQMEHLKKRVDEIFCEVDKELIFRNPKHRRKTVKAVMDIGKMRESTWTKAGGSLAWTDIRHPYQQQWTLLRMPNPLLQQLPLSRVAMV